MFSGRPDTFGEQVIRNFKTLGITATSHEILQFNATIFSVVSIRLIIFELIDVTYRMRGLCQPGNPLLRRSRCQMSESIPAPFAQPSRDAQLRGHLFGLSNPELF